MSARERTPSVWRQPMVWLVVAIPLASVAATMALVTVAGGEGATDDIADTVHRTAQVQVADLSADARAQSLGLRAQVERDGDGLHVRLLSGSTGADARLRLALRHPILADRDRVLDLSPDAQGWRTTAPVDLGHDWNMQLEPRDGRWRLQGRWQSRVAKATLQPTVGASP